ncbi:MAG: cysteine methyltransferase [Rickettsiales bacterium]|nr:MAG: cysteine methyltransferase [Rickettsiales bacterium]
MTYYSYIQISVGRVLLVSDGTNLTGVYVTGQRYFPEIKPEWEEKSDLQLFIKTEQQLIAYLAGEIGEFDLPCKLEGSELQEHAWRAIGQVRRGETISYKDLASRTPYMPAIRAIASAVGQNPISIIVPCHRIVRHDDSLGGYAAGLEAKQRLLDLERKPVRGKG